MPLFVPILRLAMLFLNVYDSYKTLKYPPPSSRRNDGLPSVRAMTQRKRDMKGCLAVWIVWCSFAVYEKFGEAVVSLFIPFYDEFKSIALLFLILTRARGAEPIYLHVIRPLLRPYTSTLDASLELLLMIGDFIFALSTFPIKLGLELWEKRFGFDPAYYYSTGILDTETEVETETTTDVSSEPPPPPGPHRQRANPNRKPDEVTFPRKGIRRPRSDDTHTHQPIASSSRTRSKQDIEPNFYTTSSASVSSTPPQQQRQKMKGRQQHEVWYPPPSAYAGDDERLQDSRTTTTTASLIELDVQVTTETQKLDDTEEWRQYPAFPSAYPPTPLVTTSRLVSTRGGIRTTTTTNMYPIINERDLKDAEEWRRYPAFPAAYPPTPLVVSGARLHSVGSHPSVVQEEGEEEGEEGEEMERMRRDENNGPEEDFRGSLEPLREPLNPGSASDSSDSYRSHGIQNHLVSSISALPAADMSSGSDEDTEIYSDVEEEEEEEEDNFNITLQTPLHHPLVVPIPRNQRPVSMTSTLASASTGLTTLHDGSLRTRSSGSGSGSGGGDDDQMEEDGEKENAATSISFTTMPLSSTVLGKKRALQGQGRSKGTESSHGHGPGYARKSGTKKRRVSTSQSPTRQQGASFTTDEAGNAASEGRDAERALTPTQTNTNTKTKAKVGGRSRRRQAPLSPSRVNAPRSPLRVNAPRSPSRVNTPRSPSRVNTGPSPSRVNAPTTRAVRPRVTQYATPPPPLLPTLGSVGIGAMTTALESTTTAPESTTTGTGTTTTENWTLVAPRRPDPILIPDKQTRRGSRPQVPIAQRSSRRLRSGESAAQARKPDSAGDPPMEQRRRRTTVNVGTATTARTTRK